MKFRKLLALSLVTALSLSFVACGGKTQQAEEKKDKKLLVGMVTDTGGIHDKSFNQSAYEGLEKAKEEGLIDVVVLESKVDADYATNIAKMVDQEVDLVVGVGFKMNAAIVEGANTYTDTKFAIVDSDGQVPDPKDEKKMLPTPKNVQGILFKANETAFLGGYVAGLTTKANKVGTVIGVNAPILNEFAAGYYAGVWTANPACEIFGQYANSFDDVAKGKNIAEQLYTQGADIIYACAGNVGNGVIESAKERNKWVVGVDRDQYEEAPKNMLTSTMKRVGVALYNAVKDLTEGKEFGGGVTIYGLESGAVGLSPSTQNIDPEVLKKAEEMAEKIKSGEVKVPLNEEELTKMFPNPVSQFMK